MKRTAKDITPIVAVKEPQATEQWMLTEAVSTFDMFKKDEATLAKAIKDRNEQINGLQREQNQDIEQMLRVRGALSALQHLVTAYKDKMQKARDLQGD